MNIAFFGSSLVSAYWNGAATYYRGIVRELNAQGHRVTFYEPDAYDRQRHRDMADPSWARVVVYSVEGESAVLDALEEARGADMIVKTSGVGVFDELLEEAVLDLKRPDNIVVFWDVDAPATLDRVQQQADDPFRLLIPRYDCIFTYGGGPPVVNAYLDWGAKSCHPIYNAHDPTTHHPAEVDPRFEGLCGFLGHRLPDREARVDEFFFKSAEALPSQRFVLGGNAWEDKKRPRNVAYVGYVSPPDHNAFNCTPRALLNINRSSMARYGFSPPTRVFEATGAGACLITDAWQGIEEFYVPGLEILVAANGDEVIEILSDLSPERAETIGKAARKRALAEHTYRQRVIQLEEILDGRMQPKRRITPRPQEPVESSRLQTSGVAG